MCYIFLNSNKAHKRTDDMRIKYQMIQAETKLTLYFNKYSYVCFMLQETFVCQRDPFTIKYKLISRSLGK